MKTGKLNVQGRIYGDCWEKAYETILGTAATSVTISGLDGNTAEEYRLILRAIAGANASQYYLRSNNDSGNNYGRQYIDGIKSTTYALRVTSSSFIEVGYAHASGNLSFSDTILYAKSGYVRTCITNLARTITGTTVTEAIVWGQSWNNTSDNITSLVILSDQANGLGIGTQIELYRKSRRI